MSRRQPLTHLLDANVLVALTDAAHVHHRQASDWFAAQSSLFATCPITQSALLRLRMQLGAATSFADALELLKALSKHPRHRFWPADLPCTALPPRGLQGHRQITDAYLAALARHHGGRLATLDRGLAALHPDVADFIG